MSRGLDGIAVTDHESGQLIDDLRDAARPHDVAIIPGVEINNLAGNEGIHLIALFPLDTTARDTDYFLVSIGALTGKGENLRRGTATKGLLEVLEEIEKRDGIAVLAHCQSSRGSLADMRGAVRTEVVRHPVVLAAEAKAEEFFDEGKRTYDMLDGSDPSYKRKLAVYQASDNPAGYGKGHGHGLASIGSRFTYFYVERPITLESLRQCFIDHDVRIEYPELGAAVSLAPSGGPRISKVEVSGGFLDGLSLDLHQGLTTVLGSKGSGKSVLIELIRFALDQVSEQPEIRKDHEKKLSNQLGPYGSVTVTIVDSGGTSHAIHRVYDPANGNLISDVSFEPSEFFPCHFLSQNQIIRLAESEAEQIKFIDSFFDFRSFQHDIETARAELLKLDKDVAELIRGRKQIAVDEATVATLRAQIAEKDRALVSPIFSKYRDAQAKKQALDRRVEALEGMIAAGTTGKEGLEAAPMPDALPTALAGDQLLRQIDDKLRVAQRKVVAQVIAGLDLLGEARKEVLASQAEWMKTFREISTEYAAEIKRMGGDAPALNQERARLVARLEQVEKELLAHRQQGERLRPVADRRQRVLDHLERRQAEYTQARRERCAWFEEKSDGQIRASVEAASNYDDFSKRLGEMKRGSYLTAAEIDAIARTISHASSSAPSSTMMTRATRATLSRYKKPQASRSTRFVS